MPKNPDYIFDNQDGNILGEFLRQRMTPKVRLSVASAYFSIGVYQHLRTELERTDEFRLLYGNSPAEDILPKDQRAKQSYVLQSGQLSAKETLKQGPLARRCEEWLRKKTNHIRGIVKDKGNFMHGKMIHVQPCGTESDGTEPTAVVGSSNFTARGLGFNAQRNIELNLSLDSAEARQELLDWFNRLWQDDILTKDIKEDVLAELRRLCDHCAPEMLYFKTLFELFQSEPDGLLHSKQELENSHLFDSAIWRKLYLFQKDGVIGAINKLSTSSGCIIADSVGLGKTFEALAIIKYFELRNENVLVLCPKRLEQNWQYYTAHANVQNNPLKEDRFRYRVCAHTDLGSKNKKLKDFNWGNYDLVVIDESHHFRNALSNRKDKHGNIISRSRYRCLMDDVIKKGGRTKVLMLSATPVNNTLTDMHNQVALITEEQDNAFAQLGIGSLKALLRQAQKKFNEWQQEYRKTKNLDKSRLLEKLDADFLRLLDKISIARSRAQIERHYEDGAEMSKKFPMRETPENVYPPTDNPPTDGEPAISYGEINQNIGGFHLSIYQPAAYLTPEARQEREQQKRGDSSVFDQKKREKFLVNMMRVGFLKRLESSAYAFTLTLERTIKKIEEALHKIEKYQKSHPHIIAKINEADVQPELMEDAEDEYGEFQTEDEVVGKRLEYHLSEIELKKWCADLEKDRVTLTPILEKARAVIPERDGKLQELKKQLCKKIGTPTMNKNDEPNHKALVFTAYADTASYLYEHLRGIVHADRGRHIALVTGGGCKTTLGKNHFNDILDNFSPQSRERTKDVQDQAEIDILIATDCISEGQNLQDCDLVINYDIHWNPVRLVQRFGRIDRIGSCGAKVKMINFWPQEDLDKYLDLNLRVQARMALVDISATQSDNPLLEDERAKERQAEKGKEIRQEIVFRNEQLKRLQKETLDLEEIDEGVTMSDLTLDAFRGELLRFIENNRKKLEEMPFGMYAVVPRRSEPMPSAVPGVIFHLKLKGVDKSNEPRHPNPTDRHFLAYVHDDGKVRYSFVSAVRTLELFGSLCRGKKEAEKVLCTVFDRQIEQPNGLRKYETLLHAMAENIFAVYSDRVLKNLAPGRGGSGEIPLCTEQPKELDDFELVTWLVIVKQ